MNKFKIPRVPPTEPKCIRFPTDLINDIENVIRGKETTFSSFVVEACRFALKELDISDKPVVKNSWLKKYIDY